MGKNKRRSWWKVMTHSNGLHPSSCDAASAPAASGALVKSLAWRNSWPFPRPERLCPPVHVYMLHNTIPARSTENNDGRIIAICLPSLLMNNTYWVNDWGGVQALWSGGKGWKDMNERRRGDELTREGSLMQRLNASSRLYAVLQAVLWAPQDLQPPFITSQRHTWTHPPSGELLWSALNSCLCPRSKAQSRTEGRIVLVTSTNSGVRVHKNDPRLLGLFSRISAKRSSVPPGAEINSAKFTAGFVCIMFSELSCGSRESITFLLFKCWHVTFIMCITDIKNGFNKTSDASSKLSSIIKR